jgi:protein phosphatase
MPENAPASAFLTHPGRVRDHNEDAFGIAEENGFWCVVDGMGGYAGGDVASAIARNVVLASIRDGQGVKTSIQAAHAAIVQAAREGKGPDHMGSTIVALKSTGAEYLVAWVGDSRSYLWNGKLLQLSRDHSLVQSMIDSGKLTADSPKADNIRNVITQCLGPPNDGVPRVDTVTGTWKAGDKVLLCSDGLHGELGDDVINAIITEQQQAGDQSIVEALVDAALQAGGSDNITAVIVSAPAVLPEPAPDPVQVVRGGGGPGRMLLSIMAGVVLLVLMFYLFSNR